jgi:hypothetical protein
MSQSDLAMLMAGLASDGVSLEPRRAIALLTEMLDRLRPTLDQADSQTLIVVGACLWRCASMEQALQESLGPSSGGTG